MQHRTYPMTRRSLVRLMTAAALAGTAAAASAEESTVIVHKDPNCGCCTGWAQHLRDSGFTVRVEETSDLESVRKRLGVPTELAACHNCRSCRLLRRRARPRRGHTPTSGRAAERPRHRGPGYAARVARDGRGTSQPYRGVLFGPEGQLPFMRFIGRQAIT